MERQVNGITIAYDKTGTGPCVALCHSLGMNRQLWFQQVPVFAQRYQVLTFDARGHGESSKPPGPYSIEMMAEDLYQLLVAEGVERVAVVGLSMGGNIAQAMAVTHPEMVQALVLADTTAWYGPEAERNWEQRAKDVEARGLAAIVEVQLGRWLSEGYRAAHPEVAARLANWLVANDIASYTASQRALGRVDLRAQVERISCPTLIIVGEDDPATPPDMARDLNRRIKGSQLLVLPQALHMSPVEMPDQFNRAVLDFLAGIGF